MRSFAEKVMALNLEWDAMASNPRRDTWDCRLPRNGGTGWLTGGQLIGSPMAVPCVVSGNLDWKCGSWRANSVVETTKKHGELSPGSGGFRTHSDRVGGIGAPPQTSCGLQTGSAPVRHGCRVLAMLEGAPAVLVHSHSLTWKWTKAPGETMKSTTVLTGGFPLPCE